MLINIRDVQPNLESLHRRNKSIFLLPTSTIEITELAKSIKKQIS